MAEDPGFSDAMDAVLRTIDAEALPKGQYGHLAFALYNLVDIIWNTRGAVDIAKIEATLSSLMGAQASGPYVKILDRELRKLDR